MSTDTVYRFLPWARRGLAAALPAGTPDGDPLPHRAKVDVQVVVAGAGTATTSATLYGPGDVVGLDPTMIVRTIPRADASNAEPNYLAAVDFDAPELPWAFTPGGPPLSGHLRPWLVLVVVRDRPGVAVTVPRGAPLPQLRIDSGAATELPDLAESWAWAHVQLLDRDAGTDAAAVGEALAALPDRNVSRLICPRRLEPDTRWLACLVPAFAAGATRGLGGIPDSTAPLAAAWSGSDQITLPVYFHWSFQTGPQGDFESLARRIRPYEASASIGRVRMHAGAASPLTRLPVDDPGRFLDMDGALQAPAPARAAATPPVPDASLDQVAAALRDKLASVTRVLADAADGKLDGEAPGDTEALGPPVYAGPNVRRTIVSSGDPTWFQELNVDPRGRVAAGLGAEVVRANQEDVVAACWQQVGDVLEAEAALSRARLALEAARRFTDRHLAPQSPARFLQLTAPMARRTPFTEVTVSSAIRPTSLPDSILDPALRRLTAPTARLTAKAARRAGDQSMRATGGRMIAMLAGGWEGVDPNRFAQPALDGIALGATEALPDGSVSLGTLGLGLVLEAPAAQVLLSRSASVTELAPEPAATRIQLRQDLRATGMLSQAHVDAARTFVRAAVTVGAGTAGDTRAGPVSTDSVLDAIMTKAKAPGPASGFLIELSPDGAASVLPLAIGSGGRVVARTPEGSPNVTVAVLDRSLTSRAEMRAALAALAPGSISTIRRDVSGALVTPSAPPIVTSGGVVIAAPVGAAPAAEAAAGVPAEAATTVTVPGLMTEAAVLRRFEQAVATVTDATALGVDEPTRTTVAFPLAEAVVAVRTRSDPMVAYPRRLDEIVRIGGVGIRNVADSRWAVTPLLDRVMAYPDLQMPAYTYLASYDRTRFCPGVDEVPPESVTLLETNPRFIAAFMAGMNHETGRELLWRGYPTDRRGTPFRRFWERLDGSPDINAIDTWGPRLVDGATRDSLAAQTTAPDGNLVLLIRGNLLRRYPNTNVLAIRAKGPRLPSPDAGDVRRPEFAGRFDPDVSFFGFPLTSADLTDGEGWFFALMEPVTEPRFGFDETIDETRVSPPATWTDVAWADLGVEPGAYLDLSQLRSLAVTPRPLAADTVAAALFQRPFEILVHAKYLVLGV